MKATKESTIRNAVIQLLKEAGYSPINATDLWDRVYSGEYERAKPGVKTVWIIGGYEFEFTKQVTSPAQAQPKSDPFEEINRRSANVVNKILRLVAVILIVSAILIKVL